MSVILRYVFTFEDGFLGLDGAAFSSRMPADKLTKQEIAFFSDIAQGSNSTILDFIFVRNKIVSKYIH